MSNFGILVTRQDVPKIKIDICSCCNQKLPVKTISINGIIKNICLSCNNKR